MAKTMGQKIREARESLGITRAEAARRAGCTRGNWWAWENDRNSPTMTTLQKVADAVECELDVLLRPQRTD